MRTKTSIFVLTALVLVAVALFACGKEEEASPTAVAQPTRPAATAAATQPPAGTVAPSPTTSAGASPTTAAPAETKLRGMATSAGMTPSRKLSEEIMLKYWYAKQEYDFNTKPRYGGIEQWVFNTKVNLSPLDPAAGCIPCTIYSSQLLNHGDNLMSDVLGGKRDDLLEMMPIPDLAKSWIWKDDKTFEMKLYDNVYWHNVPPVNGRKFTSADAKFMLDTLKKDSLHGKNYLAPVLSVDTPDDVTVVIKLSELMPDLPIYLLSPGWARAFPKECYEEKDCLNTKGIGTGPFVLKEFNPGVSFKFERFDKYFRKDRFGQQMPYLDGVVVLDMPDPATQIAAFRTGQIDNSSQGIITYAQFQAVMNTNPKSQVVLFPGTCGGDTAAFFNLEQKPFDDARVRQAVSMAINREDLYMTVFQGLAISDVFLPETYLGYDMAPAWGDWPWKGKAYFQYNLEGAKKLLADAGYPSGFKTKINGTFPATCNLMNCRPAWEYVQSSLKKVGVDAELVVMQGPEYTAARMGRTWDGIMAGISFPGNFAGDGYTYGNLNSKSSLNWWGPRPGQDDQMDDLTLKQRQTLNGDERRKLWNQIVDRVYEQQYQVQLGIPLHFRVYQPWVKNMGDHNCGWRTGWSGRGTEEDWFTEDAPKRKL